MKIEALTINYNTPDLVKTLIGSILKYTDYNIDFTIVNNGPEKFIEPCLNVIDLTEDANNFINKIKSENKLQLRNSKSVYGSAHHAYTIDKYIYDYSNADYILLFDTDVYIKNNFNNIIEFLINSNQPFYSAITDEDVSGEQNAFRVTTHCCFINRKKFIELELKFLTLDKFLDITHILSYDTGRGLYENVKPLNLKYFDDNSFFKHLKGVSWKKME